MNQVSYLPSLTGLRFYAALLIVLYHLNSYVGTIPIVSDLTRFGRSGVTFFFVLSGFVLAWSYWGKETPLRIFYWRRFARIWPLHMLATFFCGAVYVYTDYRLQSYVTWENLWPSILLIHTWFPQPAVNSSWNGATWSLANEAFFYAIFPMIAVVLARTQIRLLIAIPVLMSLVSLAFWIFIPLDGIGPYIRVLLLDYFPLSRVVQFISGVALACAMQKGWRSPIGVAPSVTLVVGWHALIFFWSEMTVAGSFWYPYSASQLFSLIPFVLLIAAVATRDIQGGESHLSTPLMVLLGQASYAWYLFHGPIILIILFWTRIQPTELSHRATLWVLSAIISQLLAIIAYKCFEHPVEHSLRKLVTSREPALVFRPSD